MAPSTSLAPNSIETTVGRREVRQRVQRCGCTCPRAPPTSTALPLASVTARLEHATQREFVYRHEWRVGDLVIWDNRCLLHAATGGYQGHARLLYRITISERSAAATAAH